MKNQIAQLMGAVTARMYFNKLEDCGNNSLMFNSAKPAVDVIRQKVRITKIEEKSDAIASIFLVAREDIG